MLVSKQSLVVKLFLGKSISSLLVSASVVASALRQGAGHKRRVTRVSAAPSAFGPTRPWLETAHTVSFLFIFPFAAIAIQTSPLYVHGTSTVLLSFVIAGVL